jgi:hypothetical protein
MCPTRADGETSLIAHLIHAGECQKRQREHFHKCPTCAHANGREVARVPAVEAAAEPVKAVAQ